MKSEHQQQVEAARILNNNYEIFKVTDYMDENQQKLSLNELSRICHEENKQWWLDLETGKPKERNIGELLMLVTSEIAEAMEGHRKNLKDDKLPHRDMLEVELVDALIRIFDMAGGLDLDLGGAFVEKMAFNKNREDHKKEHRLSENGKKF